MNNQVEVSDAIAADTNVFIGLHLQRTLFKRQLGFFGGFLRLFMKDEYLQTMNIVSEKTTRHTQT